MRFGLRRQLLAIGLTTVALPIVSIGYIRATEQALRETQTGFLATTGQSVAPLLDEALRPERRVDTQPAWFVEPLSRAPVLDGFVTDWNAIEAPRHALEGGAALRTLAGSFNGALYVHADVQHDSGVAPQFTLSCTSDNGSLLLASIAPEASGEFTASALVAGSPPIRGAWIPDGEGSQLELRVPSSPCRRQLGLWVRLDSEVLATHSGSIPGPMLSVDQALALALAENRIAGIEMFVISREGWRLTPFIGRMAPDRSDDEQERYSWFGRLFASDLDEVAAAHRAFDQSGEWLAPLPRGEVASRRARERNADRLISEVAVPLMKQGQPVAALVLRQPTDAILSLTNPARARMTLAVLGITLLIVTLLLAFATVLSLRVRRLSQAASNALDSRGRLTTSLPGSHSQDEVGDVARGFESLLKRLDEQQSWLQSLADNLSHELRTPIAVVRSSLENLRHSVTTREAESLLDRAMSGVDRLRATLLAMTRANRAEQAAREAEFLEVDLSELLRQLHSAYAATFATHRFAGSIAAGVAIQGNPELIVQMLDKLTENAVTFAPEGSEIRLDLALDDRVRIGVTNIGSSLPETGTEQLFQPLVSRRSHSSDSTHLGFGLYIARVIAEAHGGQISARNTDTGVRFEVALPRT